ncbi:MAG: hypothetical protein ACSHX5_08050 [Phycisphaerales bacterium]
MKATPRPTVSSLILTAALASTTAFASGPGCESSPCHGKDQSKTEPAYMAVLAGPDSAATAKEQESKIDAKAQKVWDRSIKSTMGDNAEDRPVKNMKMSGTMNMPAQGIQANMTIIIAGEQGMRVETEIPGLGAFSQGVSDGVAWSNDMMQGPKILEGDEAKPFIKQNDLYADLNWEDHYKSIEYKGQETVTLPDDTTVETDVLTLVDIEGENTSTQYYSTETGRLVKAESMAPMAGAMIPVTTYTMDYRDVNGMHLPFKSITQMGPVKQIMEFTEVEVNAEIDPSELAMPDDIKELLED